MTVRHCASASIRSRRNKKRPRLRKGRGKPTPAPSGSEPAQQSAGEPAAPTSAACGGRRAARANRPRPAQMVNYEFHTDKWTEAYTKRVDEMIAALKAKGVPVLWVGLPALAYAHQ